MYFLLGALPVPQWAHFLLDSLFRYSKVSCTHPARPKQMRLFPLIPDGDAHSARQPFCCCRKKIFSSTHQRKTIQSVDRRSMKKSRACSKQRNPHIWRMEQHGILPRHSIDLHFLRYCSHSGDSVIFFLRGTPCLHKCSFS